MQTDHVGRFLNPDGGYLDTEGNPLTGCSAFEGITAMQHEGAFNAFGQMLPIVKPARILEIGTASGGLCLYLRRKLNEIGLEQSPIKTFDIFETGTHSVLKNEPGIEMIYDNIFSQDYLSLANPQLIDSFIQQPGTTLVLCDGGNKIQEFKLVSPMLKSGDIIMAHDYSPNLEFFKQHIMNKIWAWMEISDQDVESAVKDNNLEPFMAEEFSKVVWLCSRKK